MEKIRIGQSELRVMPFNLGGNVFGWTLNEQQSFKILDAFTDRGFDFIDTADSYSHWANNGVGGQSETIIGNWLKSRGNRNKVIIASKVGSGAGQGPNDVSRKHILEAVDKSLARLQTDYIDLYYTHHDDGKTPVEETLSAYEELLNAGKIRAVAASNISPERLRESLEVSRKKGLPRYQALQPLYNLVERSQYERDYAPIAAEYGLTVFPYYGLASGFLTGKYRSPADLGKSARGHDVSGYLDEKGRRVLEALDQTAEKHQSRPAAVALAWLLTRPHIGAPVASATSIKQLEESLECVSLRLDRADLELLDRLS